MILITGATGKVGSEVLKRLSLQGIMVCAVTHNPRKAEANPLPHVEYIRGDFDDPESKRTALADLGFPAWQADGLLEEFAIYRRDAAGIKPRVRDALAEPLAGSTSSQAITRRCSREGEMKACWSYVGRKKGMRQNKNGEPRPYSSEMSLNSLLFFSCPRNKGLSDNRIGGSSSG